MAFGARNEDGWRLCIRKGKTILTLADKIHPGMEIKFSSQAKAKKCADALNEFYWHAYSKTEGKGKDVDGDLYWSMIYMIEDHGGLTAGQVLGIGGFPSS